FLITGGNNTALDFLVLNILMKIFNIYSGGFVVLFNCLSFSIAVTNSYLINSFWTFKKEGNKKIRNTQLTLTIIIILILIFLKFIKIDILLFLSIFAFLSIVILINRYIIINHFKNNNSVTSSLKFGKFIFLTLIGMILNSTILYILTSFVTPPLALSSVVWANIAKAMATIIILFWNFFVYKIFIFKS
ncbi:MAG: GtrA family protein, partial [Bacteroidetes bacterium]|nr:GtrA family protein [Bacteroidota bacterium]